MKLVKCDISELGRSYIPTRNQKILEEFVESGLKCMRVEDHHYASTNSGQTTLMDSIRRFHIIGVRAAARKGKLYLVRIDI